jgi:isopentenyl phosphate kinase
MKLARADIIIKLGGSAITEKNIPFSANIDALERIADELSGNLGSKKVVLVYGGGSFGHSAARKYLSGGAITSPLGFGETRAAMLSLTKIITDAFLKHEIPVFCINASSCFVLEDSAIDERAMFLRPLERALECGLLPAIGGDVVLDSVDGTRILSGDRIARILAAKLGAQTLAFGTDVDGILTENGVLDTIYLDDIPKILHNVGGRAGDVTGGMAGKMKEISAFLTDGGGTSIIFNLTKKGLLSKVLKGEKVKGTYLKSNGIRRGKN